MERTPRDCLRPATASSNHLDSTKVRCWTIPATLVPEGTVLRRASSSVSPASFLRTPSRRPSRVERRAVSSAFTRNAQYPGARRPAERHHQQTDVVLGSHVVRGESMAAAGWGARRRVSARTYQTASSEIHPRPNVLPISVTTAKGRRASSDCGTWWRRPVTRVTIGRGEGSQPLGASYGGGPTPQRHEV